jgi:hypothetical protein
MRRGKLIVLMLLGAGASACGLFSDEGSLFSDEGGLELRTDKSSYPTGSPIAIKVTNNSSDVIYYSTCVPPTLEELSDGEVVDRVGLGPVCECICTTELRPGQKWTYQVDVAWLWQNMGVSQPKIGPKYRFFWPFYRDRDMKTELGTSHLTTNTFRFELGS